MHSVDLVAVILFVASIFMFRLSYLDMARLSEGVKAKAIVESIEPIGSIRMKRSIRNYKMKVAELQTGRRFEIITKNVIFLPQKNDIVPIVILNTQIAHFGKSPIDCVLREDFIQLLLATIIFFGIPLHIFIKRRRVMGLIRKSE